VSILPIIAWCLVLLLQKQSKDLMLCWFVWCSPYLPVIYGVLPDRDSTSTCDVVQFL